MNSKLQQFYSDIIFYESPTIATYQDMAGVKHFQLQLW